MNSLRCPVCDYSKTFVYMEGVFDSETTNVMECSSCGLQFLDPMMSDAEEKEYYRSYYDNQKSRHYKDFSLVDLQDIALKHYIQYGDIYSKLIQNKNSILELGTGTGGFLRYIKNHFHKGRIVSIERSESNLRFLRKSFPEVTFLDDLSKLEANSQFDLIAAFGVLEHVRDGHAFLVKIKDHLIFETGRAVFNIPNKKNPLIELYSLTEFQKFAYMKQHYYTYTEESLKILAKKAGLSIHGFSYIQAYGLDNHLSWLINRKPKDFSFYTKQLSEETLTAYNNDLIRQKTTDLMMVAMKRPEPQGGSA